jgi:hypothetical protein
VEDGFHLVECDLWAVNQRQEITMPGRAVVCLPTVHLPADQPVIPPAKPDAPYDDGAGA